jgi:hypothetical protein
MKKTRAIAECEDPKQRKSMMGIQDLQLGLAVDEIFQASYPADVFYQRFSDLVEKLLKRSIDLVAGMNIIAVYNQSHVPATLDGLDTIQGYCQKDGDFRELISRMENANTLDAAWEREPDVGLFGSLTDEHGKLKVLEMSKEQIGDIMKRHAEDLNQFCEPTNNIDSQENWPLFEMAKKSTASSPSKAQSAPPQKEDVTDSKPMIGKLIDIDSIADADDQASFANSPANLMDKVEPLDQAMASHTNKPRETSAKPMMDKVNEKLLKAGLHKMAPFRDYIASG